MSDRPEKHATNEVNSDVGTNRFNHRLMLAIDENYKLAMAMACKKYSPNLPKHGVEKDITNSTNSHRKKSLFSKETKNERMYCIRHYRCFQL